MFRSIATASTLFAMLMASPIAFSHPETTHAMSETGLLAGLLHVLTGADHLLAMLALGLWAASLNTRQRLIINTGLPMVLTAGLLVGLAINIPIFAALGIAMSLIWLGALVITLGSNKALTLTAPVIAASSVLILAHGIAHSGGIQSGVTTSMLIYGVGVLFASCVIQQMGQWVGKKLVHHFPEMTKTAGALVSLSGLALLGTRLVAG